MRRTLPCLAAAAFLSLTGCAGLRFQPEIPAPPRAAGDPIPLKVGLTVDATNPPMEASGFAAQWVAGQSTLDMGQMMADALRGSHLFTDVRYPMPHTIEALQKADLVLNASFKRSFQSDPGKGGKAFITGFLMFLPVCFIEYNDTYGASGRIAIDDKHGNWVKEYSQTMDMTASWKLFSEARSYKEGPPAAARGLVAQLVQALIADRPLFEKFAKEKDSRPSPKAAPKAEEPALAPKEEAKSEPVSKEEVPSAKEDSPEPQPEPKPKKPVKTYDDQL